METTANEQARAIRNSFGDVKSEARAAGRKLKATGSEEFRNLVADVEDLVARVGNTLDPELTRIRGKVESGLAAAKQSIGDGAEQLQRQSEDAVNAGRRYVSDNPWQALGMAALTGLVLGVIVSRI